MSEEESEKLEECVGEGLEWLEQNTELPKSEYVEKKKAIEKDVKPLFAKLFAADNNKGKKTGRGGRAAGGRRR